MKKTINNNSNKNQNTTKSISTKLSKSNSKNKVIEVIQKENNKIDQNKNTNNNNNKKNNKNSSNTQPYSNPIINKENHIEKIKEKIKDPHVIKKKDFDENKYKKNSTLTTSESKENNNNKTKIQTENIDNFIQEITLLDTEILEPDFPIPPPLEQKPSSFNIQYLTNKNNDLLSNLNSEILIGINTGIESILNEIKNDFIENDNLTISPEQKNIENLINNNNINNSLFINYPGATDTEEIIKLQTIKILSERKLNLQKKLEKLEENYKIIDSKNNFIINSNRINNNNNDNNNNNNLIEENILKSQIKQIKETKEILIDKLKSIDQQVQNLLINENKIALKKTNNIKQFIENFEKDKIENEKKIRMLKEEKKIREKKFYEDNKKSIMNKEKTLDNIEKESIIKKKELLEKNRLKELELIQKRNKENLEKINFIKNYMNEKPANENEYLFKVLEKNFKLREEKEIKKEISKKKEKMNQNFYTKTQLEEFDKKLKENELKRILEVEEEKKRLKMQWKIIKNNLPKFESQFYQKIKNEENEIKEKKEIEDFKKKIKLKEIKNYSEAVQKLFLPKIDENIKKEREDRIKNLSVKNNIEKLHYNKGNRILLVKPDKNKPKKYNWDLKLTPIEDFNNNNNNNNHNNEINDNNNNKKIKNKRAKSANKKIPLDKPPDYLTEMRKKNINRFNKSSHSQYHQQNWENMIKNEKNNLLENINIIKIKAENLENQAKLNGQLINNKNGEINVKMQENVSNMLIDAIKAKLTILDGINNNNFNK